MNMKQAMTFLVLLLGMMLSQDAQAFYNSSTGRWLSRDPITESGHQLLQDSSNKKPHLFRAGESLMFSKMHFQGRGKFFSVGVFEKAALRPFFQEAGDFVDPLFCHNNPINRFDMDGRADAPGCGYFLFNGVVGAAVVAIDWVIFNRRCLGLAEHLDQEEFGQTPGSKLLTIANLAIIALHCPQGGAVYMHIWFDSKCNCKRNYVIICNSCSYRT